MWRVQSIVTRDWRSMDSDVQHIEWVLCIDTNAVITVYFLIWFFFVLYIFVWMLYHKIIMWSNLEYINCCVCCFGDDETAIFFFILTFLVFHILYKRWELIKKKKRKESRKNTITPPFPKIDLIMDHTLKIFGQPCPYEEKKD